ncbi:hypothetical protein D3C86_1183540 [compost metagenome]
MCVAAVAEVAEHERANTGTGRTDLGIRADYKSLNSGIYRAVDDTVVEVQGGHRLSGHHGEANAGHSALLRRGQRFVERHQQRQFFRGTLADLLTANARHPAALRA